MEYGVQETIYWNMGFRRLYIGIWGLGYYILEYGVQETIYWNMDYRRLYVWMWVRVLGDYMCGWRF